MKRDEKARELWEEVYPELSDGQPGLVGDVTSRAEAQVLRLAALYAVLDFSTMFDSSISKLHWAFGSTALLRRNTSSVDS